MGIRGDLRNTIQTINPHSTPPIGIVTMFFDRLDSGGVSPPQGLLPRSSCPYLPAAGVAPNRSEPLSKPPLPFALPYYHPTYYH
jgi:hypothetical protein